MNKVKNWVGTIAMASTSLVLLLAVGCSSEAPDGTVAADSATAERREQAIALLTAESPTATATTSPTRVTEPAVKVTPTVRPKPAFGTDADREAIEQLFAQRTRAINGDDPDGYYATYPPASRELVQANGEYQSVHDDIRGANIELPVEIVAEELTFKSNDRATVIWGFDAGYRYVSGLGISLLVKEDGVWFFTF